MAILTPPCKYEGQQKRKCGSDGSNKVVCYYWRAGRCNRTPCRFLHTELPKTLQHDDSAAPTKRPRRQRRGLLWRKPDTASLPPSKRGWSHGDSSPPSAVSSPSSTAASTTTTASTTDYTVTTTTASSSAATTAAVDIKPCHPANKICDHFKAGDCRLSEGCKFLHTWFQSDSISLHATLQGHQKAITGIALPSACDKLVSGSMDEKVRVWDCHTGQCIEIVDLGCQVGCMHSEGPCVFFGISNAVKAYNPHTLTNLSLDGPIGQVYALEFGLEMLFAGVQDGQILVWKFSAEGNPFKLAASLTGHQSAVVSLVVSLPAGRERLYSGSMDHTIKVWDLTTLQCIQTLTDHTSVVMSLLCWDNYLLSCSLDKTIKVWVAAENGRLQVTYTHKEEHGVLKLCGMPDAQSRPVLFSACNDNCVRLYDLPSFKERGKIYSKKEMTAIEMGPGGMFFTGDGTGELKVWKWVDNQA